MSGRLSIVGIVHSLGYTELTGQVSLRDGMKSRESRPTLWMVILFAAGALVGAETHWAFVPPARPTLPRVGETSWPRNEIDTFVLARLEEEGITPSTTADKETLIRRATLDLTGLPPTPKDVDTFLEDSAPDAYERVIDLIQFRKLASERPKTEGLIISKPNRFLDHRTE